MRAGTRHLSVIKVINDYPRSEVSHYLVSTRNLTQCDPEAARVSEERSTRLTLETLRPRPPCYPTLNATGKDGKNSSNTWSSTRTSLSE